MPIIKNCPICQSHIKLKPFHVKRYKGPFTCSRVCRAKLLRSIYVGSNNPNFKYKDNLLKYFTQKQKDLKRRSENNKIKFNLSPNFLLELYNKQNGLCHYTGIPMKLSTDNWKVKGQADIDVLSVDKVIPELGYVEDNIVLCCSGINKLKGCYSVIELQTFISAMILKHSNVCNIKFKKIRDNASAPFKANLGDAGFDLSAAYIEESDTQIKVFTGIAVQPDFGWALMLYPRSSVSKKSLFLANSVGLIDNGYTSEIIAIFNKLTPSAKVNIGDRLVQLVPLKMPFVEFKEIDDLNDTARGDGSFGSSGA